MSKYEFVDLPGGYARSDGQLKYGELYEALKQNPGKWVQVDRKVAATMSMGQAKSRSYGRYFGVRQAMREGKSYVSYDPELAAKNAAKHRASS